MAATRSLSGVIQVDDNNVRDGDATITFFPHGVGGDATPGSPVENGAAAAYLFPPTVLVSVTKTANGREIFAYEVNTSALAAPSVQVNWDATNIDILEISYQVVGETA